MVLATGGIGIDTVVVVGTVVVVVVAVIVATIEDTGSAGAVCGGFDGLEG